MMTLIRGIKLRSTCLRWLHIANQIVMDQSFLVCNSKHLRIISSEKNTLYWTVCHNSEEWIPVNLSTLQAPSSLCSPQDHITSQSLLPSREGEFKSVFPPACGIKIGFGLIWALTFSFSLPAIISDISVSTLRTAVKLQKIGIRILSRTGSNSSNLQDLWTDYLWSPLFKHSFSSSLRMYDWCPTSILKPLSHTPTQPPSQRPWPSSLA